MNEIKIAVCDDEEKWRRSVCELCSIYMKAHNFQYKILQYSCGEEIPNDIDADILFLDVEMEGESGFEVKQRIGRVPGNVRMVFVTSHIENMPEAFGKNVYGFISKPIDKQYFDQKMDLLIDEMNDENKTILLNCAGKCRVLRLNDVTYIKADGRYSYIYTSDSKEPLFSDKGLGFWHSYLESSDFIYSERSILVNLRYVDYPDKTEVILTDGTHLELSRRMKKLFNEVYKKYIWDKGY